VASPEYLRYHGLTPLKDNSFINEDSYKNYAALHSDIKDERTLFIGWMNSLHQLERLA
jgi:hypothetical protein